LHQVNQKLAARTQYVVSKLFVEKFLTHRHRCSQEFVVLGGGLRAETPKTSSARLCIVSRDPVKNQSPKIKTF